MFSEKAVLWAKHYCTKLLREVRKRRVVDAMQQMLVDIESPSGDSRTYLVSKVYSNMVFLQAIENLRRRFEFSSLGENEDGSASLASQSAANMFAELYTAGTPKAPLSLSDFEFYSGKCKNRAQLFDLDTTLVLAAAKKRSRRKAGAAAAAASAAHAVLDDAAAPGRARGGGPGEWRSTESWAAPELLKQPSSYIVTFTSSRHIGSSSFVQARVQILKCFLTSPLCVDCILGWRL